MTKTSTKPKLNKSINISKKADKKMHELMVTKIINKLYANFKDNVRTWDRNKQKNSKNIRKKWRIVTTMPWVSWKKKSKSSSENNTA